MCLESPPVSLTSLFEERLKLLLWCEHRHAFSDGLCSHEGVTVNLVCARHRGIDLQRDVEGGRGADVLDDEVDRRIRCFVGFEVHDDVRNHVLFSSAAGKTNLAYGKSSGG